MADYTTEDCLCFFDSDVMSVHKILKTQSEIVSLQNLQITKAM